MKKLFLFILIASFCHLIKAQNCFTVFNFYQTINLQASQEQGSIEASTVAVPFNSKALVEAGKLAPDGSDLRITDVNCNALPFFIQGLADREMNVLYVSVPTLDTEGFTLHLYYGSSEAQTSVIDGNQVFDFFDDFEDGEVDLDKWEIIGNSNDVLEENEGELQFTGTSGDNSGIFKYAAPKVGFTNPVTFDFAANANNGQVYGVCDTADLNRVGLRYQTGAQSFDTLDIIALMADTLNGGFNPGIQYPFVQVPRNDLNIISITAFIDSESKLNFTRFENYSTNDRNLDTLQITQYDFDALRPFFASFSTPILVEYVGIRTAVTATPLIDYGQEMMIGTTVATDQIDLPNFSMFPNPAKQRIHFKTEGPTPNKVSIFNLSGQRVISLSYKPIIEVGQLENGHYIVKLDYPDGRLITQKLEIIR